MLTNAITVLAAALAVASAAPTGTTGNTPSTTVTLTGVTHSVVAGRGGLRFDPDNVVAEVGDVVEWHFGARNHSVVESSFGNPCFPKSADSFFSGFFPVPEGQSAEVFQIVVKDKTPIWYYCGQTAGSHCQSGMVGVVNQKHGTAFSLAQHRELAAKTNVSVVPAYVQGGYRIPNPNPLSGF